MKRVCLFIVGIGMIGSTVAQSAPDLLLPADSVTRVGGDNGIVRALQNDATVKSIAYTAVNTDALSSDVRELNVDMGNGITFTAFQKEAYTLDDESVVWSGQIDLNTIPGIAIRPDKGLLPLSATSSVSFVVNGERVMGRITIEGFTYEVLTIEEEGHYLLVGRDFSNRPAVDYTTAIANELTVDSRFNE